MNKKMIILLSCVVLSLAMAAGVTYAFFSGGMRADTEFRFGRLDAAATITQSAEATFARAGDSSRVTMTVTAGADGAPFTYGFTVKTAAGTDAGFAAAVLVYFDEEFLGTAAAVFDGEREITPDRYLTGGAATHELRLEYHLGAGQFHNGKKLALEITCTAATADAAAVAFVATAGQYETLMRDARAGLLADGFRVVLTGDITAGAAASAVPLTLDLNGYNLHGALTLSGAGESRIISYAAGTLDALTLADPAASVAIRGAADVAAATVTACDAAAQSALMAARARQALRAGVTSAPVDVLGAYRALAGAEGIAVAGAGYADGAVTAAQRADAYTARLTVGSETVLYTVYGTGALGDAGGNLAELNALMNAQLTTDDGAGGLVARTVSYDLLLPAVLKAGARVSWRSSRPEIVAADGVFTPADADAELTLTAFLRYNGAAAVAEFTVKVKNSKDKAALLREILDAYGNVTFSEPEEQFYLPTPTANAAAQQADPGYAHLSAAEQAKMSAVNALIAASGIQDFSYADEDSLITDGHLIYDERVDSLKLATATEIHRTNLTVTATFADGTVEDALAVYIDVASVSEAMRYLNAVVEDVGDIVENIRADRFHYIDAYGNDRAETPTADNGVYAFHSGTAVSTETFGKGAPLGRAVREGSFVLPERYTNLSGGASFAGGVGEKVFYYFYYYLDGTTAYAAGERAVFDAAAMPLTLGADAGAPGAEMAAIPAFNNFFLLDPAKLPAEGTSLNLQIALYRASESGYVREGTVQNVSLAIPGALHNDKEGFEDAAVFGRVVEMLHADSDVRFAACAAAPADTLLVQVCEDAQSFVLDTASDAVPLEVKGSMAGLAAFVNLKTLVLRGTAGTQLFAPSGADDPVIAAMNGALQNLTGLTALTMNYCGVTRIDPVRQMPQLSVLDMAHNPGLTDITAAASLTRLAQADFSYCGFDFVGLLAFDSPYPEVGTFEAICSADPAASPVVTYSYRESAAATEIKTAVYTAKFAGITAEQQRAKAYLAKFDFASVAVFDKMYLPTTIAGATDARLAYRIVSDVTAAITCQKTADWDTERYQQAALTAADTWGGKIPGATTSLYLVSPGAGKTVVLQIIVILTDASGNDIAGAYYCASFAITFSA